MTNAANPTSPTRYVVVGAGAVGASIAAELHRAGVDTLLVARGAQLTALRENGLTYVRPDGSHRLRIPVAANPDEVDLTPGDVLVLATKTQDTGAAVGEWAWRPVKRADGRTGTAAADLPVVTLQNGLDNERTALRAFATVIGGVVWIPATFVVPGEVINHGSPAPAVLWLGRYPGGSGVADAGVAGAGLAGAGLAGAGAGAAAAGATGTDPTVERIAAHLRRAGFVAHVVPDIAGHKAAKLLGNLVNGLDALYPPSALRDAALARLREEAGAVYAAAGIVPTHRPPEGFQVAEIPGHTRAGNSTRQSLARGTSTEIDFLSGEIVLLGRLHGVPAPANAAVQARLHRAVAEGTAPGSLDDADLAATLPPAPGTAVTPTQAPTADTVPAHPQTADTDPAPAVLQSAGTGPLSTRPVLISADDLHRRVAQADPPVLLDVRWALGDPHGEQHYREGHLPGAVYVDLETELAGPPTPGGGRHPLPPTAQVQAAARRWGITRSVVVYDNTGGLAAARAWWLLRWAGVPEVLILDGGLAAWRGAGHAVGTGSAQNRPASDIVLDGGHLPTLTADEAAALPATGTLLDARAAERYRGEVEPVDPRAGHIPGAVSAPTTGNLREGVPLFKTADELRERFAELSGPVGVYCGSGVTAAHEIAALAVAGIDAALYPGSWSAWSADPTRPIATGKEPSPAPAGAQPAGPAPTPEAPANGNPTSENRP
jgi:thiosulfate/3-mercaptopyruvate sulfurtransferase